MAAGKEATLAIQANTMDGGDGALALRGTVRAPAAVVSPGAAVDLERLRDAFAQLCEGIQALHDAGRLHRDMSSRRVSKRRAGWWTGKSHPNTARTVEARSGW